jgi:Flp pilus assembly protein TadG
MQGTIQRRAGSLTTSATKRKRRGSALTEFALVLPLLVLILFATVETCSMIHLQQALKVATYEGARVSLIPGTTPANVEAAVKQVLSDRRISGGNVSVTPTDYPKQTPGTFIKVTTTAPAKGNSLVGAWFYGGRTLTTSVEMMKET